MSLLWESQAESPRERFRNLLLIIVLFLSAWLLAACDAEEPEQPAAAVSRMITVNGTGEVTAQPDISIIRSGYWVKEEDANTALANSSSRLAEITAGLTALGIDPADIAAPGASMNSEQIIGQDGYPTDRLLYAVNQDLAITVRNPALVGDVLNSLRVTAGAPYIYSMNVQPEFSPERRDQLLAEARGLALAKAQANAQSLAQQIGLALGGPLEVKVLSENAGALPMSAAQITLEVSFALE